MELIIESTAINESNLTTERVREREINFEVEERFSIIYKK